MERKRLVILLSEQEHRKLKWEAAVLGVTISEVVRKLIRERKFGLAPGSEAHSAAVTRALDDFRGKKP